MPIYLYWGNDQFRLDQAIKKLQAKLLDPTWISFNFDKVDCTASSNSIEDAIQGLNQLATPPFGSGDRLVWLINPPLSQQAKDFLSELERTIPVMTANAHLLLSFNQKPDGRSKTVKLLEKHATVKEFSNIPLWKTDDLLKLIQKCAQDLDLTLPDEIAEYLVEAVGNDTRSIQNTLEKIQLYSRQAKIQTSNPLNLEAIKRLIPNSAQNSLDLASALKDGQTSKALSLLNALLLQNEPALKILATLTRQFRTWTWIKVMESEGERDNNAIAKAADVKNPKRMYFLRREIQHLQKNQLKQCLRLLRELELSLKQGAEVTSSMQSKLIEVSSICQH